VACTVKRISEHNHKKGRSEDFAQHDGALRPEIDLAAAAKRKNAAVDFYADEELHEMEAPDVARSSESRHVVLRILP
jgi:hypothetical protein